MSDERSFAALRALYLEVEEAVREAGPRCDLSGRCCRFRDWGHTLLSTELEAGFAAAGARGRTAPAGAPGGGPLPRRDPPRFPLVAHPIRPDEPKDLYDDCPFLKDGACGLRGHRPLGCRLFFCDPGYQAARMGALYEEFHARLGRLHEEREVPYRYGPFVLLVKPLLEEAPAPGTVESARGLFGGEEPSRV